jgi:hypothetical protein
VTCTRTILFDFLHPYPVKEEHIQWKRDVLFVLQIRTRSIEKNQGNYTKLLSVNALGFMILNITKRNNIAMNFMKIQ